MTDTPPNAPQPERQPDLTASDPYQVLGLSPAADQIEIKQAYFTLIRRHPPENDPEKFKIIRAAYEKIKSAQRRQETDIFLPQSPPSWQPPRTSLELDTAFHATDALLALRQWGELGRTDFQEDFKEIAL